MQYWFASFRDNCGRHAGLSLLAWHVLFAWFAAGMFSAFNWFLVCRRTASMEIEMCKRAIQVVLMKMAFVFRKNSLQLRMKYVAEPFMILTYCCRKGSTETTAKVFFDALPASFQSHAQRIDSQPLDARLWLRLQKQRHSFARMHRCWTRFFSSKEKRPVFWADSLSADWQADFDASFDQICMALVVVLRNWLHSCGGRQLSSKFDQTWAWMSSALENDILDKMLQSLRCLWQPSEP